jgi:DNA (cytosine-5)-methyltransferase 1
MKKSVIDLYSGVGGLSLGAIHAGLDLVGSVELDKTAFDTHELNFPNSINLNEDVSRLTGEDLLSKTKQTELFGLIGGPPCQGFSNIGKRDINDPRNQLFINFFRLARETKPVFFLAENVRGILDSQYDTIRQNAFSHVIQDYNIIPPTLLNAKNFGVPTSRPRVFFIGIRKDIQHGLTQEKLLNIHSDEIHVIDALEGLNFNNLHMGNSKNANNHWTLLNEISDNSYAKKISMYSINKAGNKLSKDKYLNEHKVSGMIGTKHTPSVIERFSQLLPGETDKVSRCRKLDPNGLCPTLRAGTASDKGSYMAIRPIHPFYNRVITPREAARIQGFPDWFLFHPTKWHSFRQIGNSVSPIMAKIILETIIKNVET